MAKGRMLGAVLAALTVVMAIQPAMAATSCPNAGFTEIEANASALTRDVLDGPKAKLHVHREQLSDISDLAGISVTTDAYDTQIRLKFTQEGAKRLHDATTNRSGMRAAFVIGDRAVAAATWEGPYGMDADLGIQVSLGRPVPQVLPLVKAVQACVGNDATILPPAP